ncbi:hypothetical protein VNI00_012156 [Paramarasmius palmivorus]|uniref:F-box domain-containing protein n=1 Tax=Paramarasmius palmivorus TaxID=297713 RepID=A0AAW0C5J0_9AGAR
MALTYYSRQTGLRGQRIIEQYQYTQLKVQQNRHCPLNDILHYCQQIRSSDIPSPPIHRLPTELLLAIFSLATDSSADSLDLKQGLWLFSHVCSSWRHLVLAMPYLWSHIQIKPAPVALSAQPTLNRVQALETYLSRSQNLPISAKVTLKGDSDLPLLHTLMAHSQRWRVFKACMPAIFYHDLSPIKYSLPLLEHISLSLPHALSSRVSTGIRIDAFGHAPVLQLVDTPNWHFDLANSLDVPWEQVRHFRSRCAAGLSGILERMVNVEEIEVEGFPFDSYTSGESSLENGKKIGLPRLRRLRTRIDCTPIFEHCYMPALEELALTHTRYMTDCPLLKRWSSLDRLEENSDIPRPSSLHKIHISHLTTGLADVLLEFLLSQTATGIEELALGTWAVGGLEKILTLLASPFGGCCHCSHAYCAPKVLPDLHILKLEGNLMDGGMFGRLGEIRQNLRVKAKWFQEYPNLEDIRFHSPRLDFSDV